MENDSFDLKLRLVKSNYILSEVRRLNNLDPEVYVKWFVGGAFNGGGFLKKIDYRNTLSQIYFCEKAPPAQLQNHRFDLICLVPEMTVLIEDQNLHSNTEECILSADQTISSLLKEKREQFLSRVQQLQFYINYECSEKEADLRGRQLVRQIFESFDGKLTITPSLPSLKGFEIDAELTLNDGIDEDSIINRLKESMPGIRKSLYGVGYNGNESVYPEVKWFHLAARHF
jgi:hypothetical protein